MTAAKIAQLAFEDVYAKGHRKYLLLQIEQDSC